MKIPRLYWGTLVAASLLAALLLLLPAHNQAQIPPTTQLISESALLAGLAPGALFPFIDTTPRNIVSAHVAITDGPLFAQRVLRPQATFRCWLG